jgi:nucleotide-binding universal stress UspA family protein
MNIIKSLLARLQSRLDSDGLADQLLLLQPEGRATVRAAANGLSVDQPINLVVGYSGSEKSQIALDLTLWMAYQTRLATNRQIVVHVVYVIEPVQSMHQFLPATLAEVTNEWRQQAPTENQYYGVSAGKTVLKQRQLDRNLQQRFSQLQAYEDADRILWEARTFAEKWKGNLSTHLRFGTVAEELATVLDIEEADVLILGCSCPQQSLIEQLQGRCPCPVIGIPA